VIQPIAVSARFREIDTPVMLGVALLLLALLVVSKSIGRLWGFVLLALYAAYMVVLFSSGVAA
jgi:cation:H+ antiporter